MPTFFARRYMRSGPGPIERVVGPALLVLVALVFVTFLITTGVFGRSAKHNIAVRWVQKILGVSDQPLFYIDPKDLQPSTPSDARRFALNLLPSNLGDYRRDELSAVTLEAEPRQPLDGDALTIMARSYGAQWRARARYARPASESSSEPAGQTPSCDVLASVFDMGDPAHAFGLCTTRRPKNAEAVSIGAGGWMDAQRGAIAFWAGRYYTELQRRGDLTTQDLNDAASQIATGQLVYGRPFWAETVLPAAGQVRDSLRYVRGAPMGLEPLDACWLADYEDGVTLGVHKIDGSARESCLNKLRERFAPAAIAPAGEPSEESQAYAQSESAADTETTESTAAASNAATLAGAVAPQAVAGIVQGRSFVAWPQGPYLFLAAGPDPDRLQSVAAAVAERGRTAPPATAGKGSQPGAEPAATVAGFPDPGDPAILPPTTIERYTGNLYEKIDGREPQFRAYDFVELRVGAYVQTARRETYEVFLFDMAQPGNALGIYKAERTGDVQPVDIGREGYVSGASVFFWKGRYYVYILGPAEGDAVSAKTAERIAGTVAATITDDGRPFWAEKLFPTQDMVPGSFSYQAKSGLGYEFINRMFLAKYKTGDAVYQLYLLRTDGPEAARALFDTYAAQLGKYDDKVLKRAETPGGETVVSEFFGVFDVAFYTGRYYGGVAECDNRDVAEQKAAAFRDALPTD